MQTVTVYSKPSCVQCDATKRHLNKIDVAYDVVDVSVDEEAFNYVVGLGYSAVPVVVVGDDHWSGYQPDKLNALKEE